MAAQPTPASPPVPQPQGVTFEELDKVLGFVASEQRKLLELLRRQREAMESLDADRIALVVREQEQSRSRLASLESRRRAMGLQLARELRLAVPAGQEPTLRQLATAIGDSPARQRLLGRRDELRAVVGDVATASQVTGRIAGAMLGHLNSALRLLAAAMRDAGTYNRKGSPRCSGGLGAIELIG